jgi:hypothetical protein
VSLLRDITDGSEALKGNESTIIVQAEYTRVCLRKRKGRTGMENEMDGRSTQREDGGRVEMLS